MIEGFLIVAPGALVVGELFVRAKTRDKFAECECVHLAGSKIVCPWASILDDDEPVKQRRPIRDERQPFLPRASFNWGVRLDAAEICARLCLHNPHCRLVSHIPEYINPPHFAGWRFDGSAFHHPAGGQIIAGAQIKNPAFKAVAFGTRKAASSSADDEGTRRKRKHA